MSWEKPIVHYRGEAVRVPCYDADSARLYPVDHRNHVPGQSVSNTKAVYTSGIVSWDEATGRIETQNTVYMPQAKG